MTQTFYDDLAPFYHLIHADWNQSVIRQAGELDSVIRELSGRRVREILDATCGIGTQALGLAALGYQVTGSDISADSIARSRLEAEARGLSLALSVADLLRLHEHHGREFDLVISCDNAVPHLLSDGDILAAFRQMYQCTRPGGACITSVRDYAALDTQGTKLVPFGVRREGQSRHAVFQIWEFHGAIYDLDMYFVEDDGAGSCRTRVFRSRYYAVTIGRLMELMTEAGYKSVRRLDGRFFQPLLIGERAG